MNIGQMLNQSGVIDSIAKEIGVDQQTARTGAAVLLPAILAGMGRDTMGAGGARAADPALGGLGSVLGALSGAAGGSSGGLLDLVLGAQPTPTQPGNEILGQIFGSKDVSRSVAEEAAGAAGLDAGLLKKMLPLLAMAVVGYLGKQAVGGAGNNQSAAVGGGIGGAVGNAVIGSIAGQGGSSGGSLGGLLGALVTGLATRR